jgi:hypothetical protein
MLKPSGGMLKKVFGGVGKAMGGAVGMAKKKPAPQTAMTGPSPKAVYSSTSTDPSHASNKPKKVPPAIGAGKPGRGGGFGNMFGRKA